MRVYMSSDCYYSANCENCSDCMFSFNLRNKRHTVGNVQLPREKYLGLKKKLVGEILGELLPRKRVISIAEILGG